MESVKKRSTGRQLRATAASGGPLCMGSPLCMAGSSPASTLGLNVVHTRKCGPVEAGEYIGKSILSMGLISGDSGYGPGKPWVGSG